MEESMSARKLDITTIDPFITAHDLARIMQISLIYTGAQLCDMSSNDRRLVISNSKPILKDL